MRRRSHTTRIGTLLLSALLLAAGLLIALTPGRALAFDYDYTFVGRWPTLGTSGYSPLDIPEGIAVGPSGNIFVADTANGRIQKYDNRGRYRNTYTQADGVGGALQHPLGVTLDSSGNMYVADSALDAIVMLDSSGTFLKRFATFGTIDAPPLLPGAVDWPWGLTVDDSGFLYVADYYNNTVQVFDTTIAFPSESNNWGCIAVWGQEEPSLGGPSGLALDAAGDLWVADAYTNRLVKYTVDRGVYPPTASYAYELTSDYDTPYSIAVNADGFLYVTDTYHNRVLKIDPVTGLEVANPLGGSLGSADYQMDHPEGVTVDSNDSIYIVDTQNNRVLKYANRWADDSDPPVTASNIPDGRWVQGPFAVSLNATDTQSGVDYTMYGIDVPSPTNLYSGPFTIYAEGTTSVTFQSIDLKVPPNTEDPQTHYLQLDNTPPVSSTNATSTWTGISQPVSFSAEDALSGWAWTRYRVGGGAVTTYTAPFEVPSEAVTQVEYASGDNAGNVEQTRTVTVRMDSEPPTTTSNVLPQVYRGSAVVTLAAFDAVSGVADTYYSLDGSLPVTPYTTPVTVSTEGTTTLKFYSRDLAGNVEPVSTQYVVVDGAPPVTTSDIDAAWHSDTVTVTLAATDMFGVANTYYRINGGADTTYTSPFQVPWEGQTTIDYWSVDFQANSETPISRAVKIDRTAPTSDSNADDVWRQAGFAMTIDGQDALSGIAHFFYQINDAEVTTFTGPFDVTDDGYNHVDFWGVDVAGNRESTNTAVIKLDHSAPLTSCDATDTSPFVTLTATDTLTGVASTFYSTDGSFPTTLYTGVFSVPMSGRQIIKYYSVDALGNVEQVKTTTIAYDSLAPVTTSNIHSDWEQPPFDVVLSAVDDGGSGVAATYYRIESGPETTYTAPFAISDEGTTNVTYWSVDVIGNMETPTVIPVRIDSTDPTTTSNADGVWHKGSFLLTLTGQDLTSGLRETWYRVGNGADVLYAGPVTITMDGANTVTYWSVDNAGNREQDRVSIVKVDATPPTTGTSVMDQWYHGPVTVSLFPADALSGVAATYHDVSVGDPAPSPVRYEQTNSRLAYTGTWYTSSNINHSGGNYRYTNSAGGNVTVTFKGTSFAWITAKAGSFGKASVTLDGAPVATVDLYAYPTRYQQTAWSISGLSDSVHTVRIARTGTKNAFSTGYSIGVDAVDIVGRLVSAGSNGFDDYTAPFVISAEGTTPVTYYSTDQVGNVEATHTIQVRIDENAPTTTSDALPSYLGTATIDLTATDAVSGVASTLWRIDGGEWTEGRHVVTGEVGTHILEFHSSDVADNDEEIHAVTFDVKSRFEQTDERMWFYGPNWTDYPNPERSGGSCIQAASSPATGWITFDGTAFDLIGSKTPLAGILRLTLDGGTPVLIDLYSGSPTLYLHQQKLWSTTGLAPGAHILEFEHTGTKNAASTGTQVEIDAIDVAGGLVSARPIVDTVPPTTTDDVPEGWYRNDALVSLSAIDGGSPPSGVAVTRYRLDDAEPATYTAPLPITTEGTTSVTYWSVDVAGNVEDTGAALVRVDATPPTSMADVDTAWHDGPRQLSITASDALSGIGAILYSVNGSPEATYTGPVTISDSGENAVTWRAIDAVGNAEELHAALVKVDPDAPVTASDTDGAWHDAPVTVTLTATDALSGVADTFYRVSDGPVLPYSAPFTIETPGENELSFWSVDTAGNTEATRSATVRVDLAAPVTESDADSAWHKAPHTVSLTPADPLSGVRDTFFALDGSSAATYTAPVTVTGDGEHTLEFWSTDAAGNTEATRQATVRVDAIAPESSCDATASYVGTATIHISAADNHTGVAASAWRLDAGEWTTGTVVTTALGGSHTLQFASTDGVGNAEAARTATFTVTVRHEDTAAELTWQKAWTTQTSPVRSGGGWTYTRAAGTGACVNFTGTRIAVVSSVGNSYGIARVLLDGAPAGEIDYYAATAAHMRTVWTSPQLSDGPHQLRIEYTNTKNPASSGYLIAIDALDVTGKLVPDTEAPVTESDADSAWHKTSASVSLSATDTASFVRDTFWCLDGSSAATYTAPVTVTGDGEHTLEFWSTDAAGNTEATRQATVRVDAIAPESSCDATASYVGTATIHISAADNHTGVAASAWRLDAGEWTTGTVVTTALGGSHTLQFASTDGVGNAEAARTATFTVTVRHEDTAAELTWQKAWTTQTSPVRSGGGWTYTRNAGTGACVNFTGTRIAVVSSVGNSYGIARVLLDGAPAGEIDYYAATAAHMRTVWTSPQLSDGPHQLRIEYTNTKNPASSGYLIAIDALDVTGKLVPDTEAPVTESDADSAWHKTSASVSLSATDTASFVRDTFWCLDGSSAATYTAPVTVTGDGEHTLEFWSTDAAGNTEATRQATVRVDAIAPESSCDATASYVGTATIQISAADNHTGVAASAWRLDAGEWTTGTVVATSVLGTHALEFYSTDMVGNVEATRSASFSVGTGSIRYEENNSLIAFDGAWTRTNASGRSAGAFTYLDSSGAVYVKFDGKSIDLIGSTTPSYGKGRLTLDGGAPVYVDFYSAGYLNQRKVHTIAGLAEGTHILKLEWTGTKNPSSTGTRVCLDAVDVGGTLQQASVPIVPKTRFEENDGRLLYEGAWTSLSASGRSAGAFTYLDAAGTVHVKFSGTSIDLIGSTTPAYGKGRVTVDGGTPTEVDFYSTGYLNQRKVFSLTGLSSGSHTLKLEWTGTKNAASTGTRVCLDAVDVGDTLQQATLRFEETNALMAFDGAWRPTTASGRSAGAFTYLDEAGAAYVAFTGTGIDLIGSTTPAYGIARVTLDAGTSAEVDLYSSGYLNQKKVFSRSGLSPGSHTLKIEWTGTKNPASTGTRVCLDAVDVAGTLQQASVPVVPKTRYEENDERLLYGGDWTLQSAPGRSAGAYAHVDASATVHVTFTGSAIDLIATTAPAFGKARVTIDGGAPVDVDFYSKTYLHKRKVFGLTGLSPGEHTLRVEWTGTKRASSTGTRICLDAVDIDANGTLEQGHTF